MSTEYEVEFDLSKHLESFYAIKPIEEHAGEDIILNPGDDRSQFSGAGFNIHPLLSRKYTFGIPFDLYPLAFKTAYTRSSRDKYSQVIGAVKSGRARYDEGIFDRPPGAVLECRHRLVFLMKSHGVESLQTRFFGEQEFSVRTIDDLLDLVEVGSDFLSTFSHNFMVLGVPFYYAAGIVREDDGFSGVMKEETRRKYRTMPTGKEWISYHRYIDIIFAFAHSTEAERKALFESMVSSDSIEGINVSLGGRIRDNFYHGTGIYPPMSMRYAGELALQLVKHGIVKPVIEHETLEFTAAGRRLIDILPASCDDPDKYGRFHDFSMNPPAIPLKEAANVEAWLMDFFGRLKDTLATLSDEKASVAD